MATLATTPAPALRTNTTTVPPVMPMAMPVLQVVGVVVVGVVPRAPHACPVHDAAHCWPVPSAKGSAVCRLVRPQARPCVRTRGCWNTNAAGNGNNRAVERHTLARPGRLPCWRWRGAVKPGWWRRCHTCLPPLRDSGPPSARRPPRFGTRWGAASVVALVRSTPSRRSGRSLVRRPQARTVVSARASCWVLWLPCLRSTVSKVRPGLRKASPRPIRPRHRRSAQPCPCLWRQTQALAVPVLPTPTRCPL